MCGKVRGGAGAFPRGCLVRDEPAPATVKTSTFFRCAVQCVNSGMSATKSFSSENVVGPQKTCEAAAQGRRGGRSRSVGRLASLFFGENASLVIKTSRRHGGGSSGGRRAHDPLVFHPACPALARGEDPTPRALESTHSAQACLCTPTGAPEVSSKLSNFRPIFEDLSKQSSKDCVLRGRSCNK